MEQSFVFIDDDPGESPTGELCSACGVELTIMAGGNGEASLWCGCGALGVLS